MATYKAVVQSTLTAEKAFDYLANLENLEEWDPGVTSAKKETDTPQQMGAIYAVTANRAKLRYKITAYKTPHFVGFEAKTRFFESKDAISIIETDNGCEITYDAILLLNGQLHKLDRFLTYFFNRIGDKAAQGLAKHLQGKLTETVKG